MTRFRRPPRRQGVVYGPIQNREGYEASSLIGRILGMLVVAAAVSVLAVGSMAFLGGLGDGAEGPAATSPASTAAAVESPRTAPPTAPPTQPAATSPPPATEAPTVSPAATEAASPGPTTETTPPGGLEVREGPGFVTFGTANNSGLRITDARTSFGLTERITWSAHLTQTANSVDLRVETSKVDPATGSEELVVREEVRPRVSGAQIFLRRVRPDRALDGPGIYVVRYLRGDTVMAEGSFEVQPET